MDTIQYQITAAGVTRRQVERLSEAAIDVICARGDAVNDRDFIHGMPVAGHKVLDRKRSGTVPTDALGSMQAGGNVDIFVTVI